MENTKLVEAVVEVVVKSVSDAVLLTEAGRRGLSEVKAVTDEALLAEAQRRGMEFANWTDEGVREEAEKRGLLKLDQGLVVRWLTGEATGNDKREVADNLPAHTLADVLVAGGNADMVLGEMDDDALWDAISDKDWVVQRNVDELDQESLLDSIDESTKEDMCEQWWKDSKAQLLTECDDGELWEAIDNKDQFKGEANVEAVERILTDCDTDGLIKALEVIGRRLSGW